MNVLPIPMLTAYCSSCHHFGTVLCPHYFTLSLSNQFMICLLKICFILYRSTSTRCKILYISCLNGHHVLSKCILIRKTKISKIVLWWPTCYAVYSAINWIECECICNFCNDTNRLFHVAMLNKKLWTLENECTRYLFSYIWYNKVINLNSWTWSGVWLFYIRD